MDTFDPFAFDVNDLKRDSSASSGKDESWTPILPAPADAPKLTRGLVDSVARPHFAFSQMWRYVSATGERMMFVARYDKPANGAAPEKDVRPFTYGRGKDGVLGWRSKNIPGNRPLYRLDRLAAEATAPVLIVEGEKTADAAQLRFPDYVVTTSSGGAHAAGKSDWAPLVGRRVTLWPDADESGRRYVEEVARLLQGVGAAAVGVVEVPRDWTEGWDLADEPPPGVTDATLAAMLAGAASALEEPLPLFPPLGTPEPYPIEYLGSVLSPAAAAVARKVQVPMAMAAQSVLAVASLAAQAHADVRLPFGQTRPLSLFLVTIAASGDRKTTADNEALWPISTREKRLQEEHDLAMIAWRIEHGAWSAQRKKVESKGSLTLEQRKEELTKLGPEPEKPLLPLVTAPDPTIEGLVKAWVTAPAALGLFTAEGGMFVGGHGMADESKLRTAASLSELWDSKPVKRLRATDGVTLLFGRRLALHLMVQPGAASRFLTDVILKDQGLLSRVLVAAPPSLAGARPYREASPADEAVIRAYGARILSLVEARWPLREGKRNELESRELPLSQGAAQLWIAFANHVEEQSGPQGDLAAVADFAAKTAEHAARIAGVLTLVSDRDAEEIGGAAMEGGIALADWYLAEALRLAMAGRTDPRLLKAQELLTWLQSQEGDVPFRAILQFGPASLRTKAKADAALTTLKTHGWIQELSQQRRRLRVVRGSATR